MGRYGDAGAGAPRRSESRRVQMTKRLLNASLLELLEQQPLPRITVTQICNRADVNRSTFYSYFTDPYDQLHRIEEAVTNDMVAGMDRAFEADGISSHALGASVRFIVGYVDVRRDMFRALLGEHCSSSFHRQALPALVACVLGTWAEDGAMGHPHLHECIFALSGTFNLIWYWLNYEPATSAEEIAQAIIGMTGQLVDAA